ncbi:anhydro-N-acetylmuramic acid kinase [Thalassobacillus hwangdonensis]|uniref:Anhydro-N-acetylmuramic acid kinase n=1 Tax=Thalassobacillus hwangdonensis TaxID=546108 RepID=A0ABW3KZS2_9BACI
MHLPKMTVVGLMSGTSLDGMDIAVIDVMKDNTIDMKLKHFTTIPYDPEVKARLEVIVKPSSQSPEISSMNMLLGEVYADGILTALDEVGLEADQVDLISTHGQTIFHDPLSKSDDPYYRPNTLQIGDIGVIAERTGITTIGDFRTRDMAVDGQGAPLVPFLDYQLLKSDSTGRILVNIGGISNFTVIPKNSDGSDVVAYDTGPGNMIIDAFISWMTDGEHSYDEGGKVAASGAIDYEWLQELMEHPYYAALPPKSTGRELFGIDYAKRLWSEADMRELSYEDRLATVTALTSFTLSGSLRRHIDHEDVREIYISGGGWHNKTMMKWMKTSIPEHVHIGSSKELGVDSDAKEAIAFALFGYLGFHRQPNNLPSATGANKEVIMGKICWGSN